MSERPAYAKLYAPMVAVALVVIAADQITKHFATGLGSCQDPASRPSSVGLCLAHNEGMAFSVGWGSGAIISAVAVTIVVVLFVAARKMPLHARVLMGAIAGGATGNVIDRAFRAAAASTQHRGFMGGAVVDFLYTNFWATFNVADSAVVVGGILLSIVLWRLPDPGDAPDGAGPGDAAAGSLEADRDHLPATDRDRVSAGDEPGGTTTVTS